MNPEASALLSAIPDTVFEIDLSGQFTFFHAHGVDSPIEGYKIDDLLPKGPAEIVMQAVHRAIKTGEPQRIKYSVPIEAEVRFFQASLGPSSDNKTVVSIVRDITSETKHERDQSDQKRCLEEANASLEQFVHAASHDLREPLSGVAGYASLLKRRYASVLDAQGLHFLDMILESTRNMDLKIDALLALSRINKGKLTDTFDIIKVIQDARHCLDHPNNKTKVELSLPLPFMIRGDRGQITEVFQNLFSNSIKYCREVPVRIEIGASDFTSNPNMLLIWVQDNGLGFDMKFVDRIFGVFQRLYTTQQYPGTGIGLTIVKKIVERHGGNVWAESVPGRGSTFFFTLPKANHG